MNDEKLASAGASSILSSIILGIVGFVGGSTEVLIAALVFLLVGIFLTGIFSDSDGPSTEYPPEDEGRYE